MNSLPDVEIGSMLCRFPNGALTRGAIGIGTPTSVTYSDKCPSGTVAVATGHSHPKSGGGSPQPSAQDLRETKRLGVPAICIYTEEKASCYAVKNRW